MSGAFNELEVEAFWSLLLPSLSLSQIHVISFILKSP